MSVLRTISRRAGLRYGARSLATFSSRHLFDIGKRNRAFDNHGVDRFVAQTVAGGSDFRTRRKAVLIKDGTNGYNIRNVLSVATNDLTFAFSVPVAPASGVAVGKCVNYAPANSGHPSFSARLVSWQRPFIRGTAGCQTTSIWVSRPGWPVDQCPVHGTGTKSFQPNPIGATITLSFDDATTRRRASRQVSS